LRFFHQGQFEGRKKRISPHLVRAPQEPPDESLKLFYDRLLSVLGRPGVRGGRWQLLECMQAWDGNWTWDCFLAFAWEGNAGDRLIATVNFAPNQSQCYVRMPMADLAGRSLRFMDLMGPASYERAGDDVVSKGLYLDLQPWGYHVFDMKAHP
jgi:hypothetical protein